MSTTSPTNNEPCGSWRAVKIIEGMYAEERWCERTDGPCPFPGTVPGQQSERRCATEPGTTLRVSWADSAIDESLVAFKRYAEGMSLPPRGSQDLAVAIDALRACGAKGPVCDGKHAYLRSCPKHGRCLCASEAASPANPSCPVHGTNAPTPERAAASGETT